MGIEMHGAAGGSQRALGAPPPARVLIRNPKRRAAFFEYANNVLMESSLPGVERQWAIVRTIWRCDGQYAQTQHIPFLKQLGGTDEDIAKIKEGPSAAGLTELQHAILKGVDEYVSDWCIHDDTWDTLARYFDETQLIDLCLVVGWYVGISATYNSWGLRPSPRKPTES